MKKLLYLLSWFVVFVPAVVFADSDIKSGLPPTIPNYNWETSFETINSENTIIQHFSIILDSVSDSLVNKLILTPIVIAKS